MRRPGLPAALLAAFLAAPPAFGQAPQSVELLGHLGGRPATLQLHVTSQPDGAARLTGDYLILPTLQQRYLDGERSKQLGVTLLREGSSPILYGRPASATLQGTWSDGVLKGMRYGPSGQQRERFEFSEKFPSLEAYSAAVRCEVSEARYTATLAYAVEGGKLKSLDWRSRVAPADHPCVVAGLQQSAFSGGLQFAAGKCRVTLRDLGEQLMRITAEDCAEFCGSQAYLEPMLIDRRGQCQVLRPATAR